MNSNLLESGAVYCPSIAPISDDGPRPLWSVMVPTFNCAKYIWRALDSILSQDFGLEEMQIEVIDDHSSENIEAIVHGIGGGRVGFYRQSQNVGHTKNFETCLQRSRGHLVHILHGDDAVRPGFYRRMSDAFAQYPKIGAAFCRNLVIDEQGNWTSVSSLEASESGVMIDILKRLAVKQRIQTPAMVVRREVYEKLGSFDHRLSWTEDWEMWARIAAQYPVWHEVEPLALYRVHDTSNSSRHIRSGENLRDLDRLFTLIERLLPEEEKQLCKLGRRIYALDALQKARIFLGAHDFSAARAQIYGALRLSSGMAVLPGAINLLFRAAFHGIKYFCRTRVLQTADKQQD